MNALAISIVHPAYEQLRRTGRFLHFIAGVLILLNALHQLQQPQVNYLYFWCQLIISADILIMVFASHNLVQEQPRTNMIFRGIESLIFLGAAFLLLAEDEWLAGSALALVGIAYAYLMYCERKVVTVEKLVIQHSGITISGIPNSRFFLWTLINEVEVRHDHITIVTSANKTFRFRVRQNLQFEELDQIHEFCKHYLSDKF